MPGTPILRRQPFPVVVQKTLDKKRNSRTKHTARHIITGHFLKYDESYAEDYMLEEAPIAVAQVKLHPSGNVKLSHKLIEADQSSSLPKSRINLLEAVCGPNSHAQPLPYTRKWHLSPYRANLSR